MQIKNIKIVDINSEGCGVGRTENFPKVLFIKETIPGEAINAIITKEEKGFARAETLNIIEASSLRRIPPCKHFGVCGGCSVQHIKYVGQTAFKQKQVSDALSKLAKLENINVLDIIASPSEFQYRNKMEFHFSAVSWIVNESDKKLPTTDMERRALGLFPQGRFDKVLNIEECHLHAPVLNKIRNFIYNFCLSKNISFYNPKLKKGLMRELIFRTNSKGEILTLIVFSASPGSFQTELFLALEETFPEITSLFYSINKKDNESFTENLKLIAFKGKEYFFETVLDKTFKINAKSFFQMNTEQAQNLAVKIIELGNFQKDEIIYDLYCGVGVFGLLIAPLVKRVIGMESSISALKDANENAALLSIKNIKFFKGKVLSLLTEDFLLDNEKADTIIIDPPRAGLEEKLCLHLLVLEFKKIIYVSCNPASLARDISFLKRKYNLEAVLPLDMFPQTPHVEVICVLTLI